MIYTDFNVDIPFIISSSQSSECHHSLLGHEIEHLWVLFICDESSCFDFASCLLCVRIVSKESLQPGSRGHSHDEGPVHEPVGRPGHVLDHSGNTTGTPSCSVLHAHNEADQSGQVHVFMLFSVNIQRPVWEMLKPQVKTQTWHFRAANTKTIATFSLECIWGD